MRQAQKMQEQMKAKQEELEATEYTGSASGGLVSVVMTGQASGDLCFHQARSGGPG